MNANTKAVMRANQTEAVPAIQTTAIALTDLAKAVTSISEFITEGGLLSLLQGQARSSAVSSVITGLIGKDGRGNLDPRLVKQNALETAHMVEAFFKAYQDHLKNINNPNYDSELKDAEADFKKNEGQ